MYMIVAIPPTFYAAHKNFANKTFRKKVRFISLTLPRCVAPFSSFHFSGQADPYHIRRPLYMVVTVACHCCSIMYSSRLSKRYWRESSASQHCKKRMTKIKEEEDEEEEEKKKHMNTQQSPVISFATFISFGPFMWMCVCVFVRSRIDQLCTYYLRLDVCSGSI